MEDTLAARFNVQAEHVSLLNSPTEYRFHLEDGLDKAKRRCGIVSLYVGAEQQTIIRKLARRAAEDHLKTFCVVDCCRTLRPERQKSGVLLSAAEAFNDICLEFVPKEGGTGEGRSAATVPNLGVYLFLSPAPYRWVRWFPYRMQECLGVLHWKFYIFDDDVILTGANISSSYLSDRHDRWILIRNEPRLCDALTEIAEALMPGTHEMSFASDGYVLQEPSAPLDSVWARIERILQKYQDFSDDDGIVPKQTVRLHMGIHCGYAPKTSPISRTEPAFMAMSIEGTGLLDKKEDAVILASPYLNLAPETVGLLQRKTRNASLHIVGPSPGASSFYNGGPVLSAIPFAYLRLTSGALKQLAEKLKVRYSAFTVAEGATFHAKGIWSVGRNADGSKRMLTLAGSTNFSLRSQQRDLECLFLLDTSAPTLVKQFEGELTALKSTSKTHITWQILRQGLSNARWPARLIAKFFATHPFFKSML